MPFLSQIDTLQNQSARGGAFFSIPKEANVSNANSTRVCRSQEANGCNLLGKICNKIPTDHLFGSVQNTLTQSSPAFLTGIALGVVGTLTIGKLLNIHSGRVKAQVNSQNEQEKKENLDALLSLKEKYQLLLIEKKELESKIAGLNLANHSKLPLDASPNSIEQEENLVDTDAATSIANKSESQAGSQNSDKEDLDNENALSQPVDSNQENASNPQEIDAAKQKYVNVLEALDSIRENQTTLSNETPQKPKNMV